jgi:hypothetical protein
VSYNIFFHFTWPLYNTDPKNQPELIDVKKRAVGAVLVGAVGLFSVSSVLLDL